MIPTSLPTSFSSAWPIKYGSDAVSLLRLDIKDTAASVAFFFELLTLGKPWHEQCYLEAPVMRNWSVLPAVKFVILEAEPPAQIKSSDTTVPVKSLPTTPWQSLSQATWLSHIQIPGPQKTWAESVCCFMSLNFEEIW